MKIFNYLIDFIYPPKCPICGQYTDKRGICYDCRSRIEINFGSFELFGSSIYYVNRYSDISAVMWHRIKYSGYKYLLTNLGYQLGFALKNNIDALDYDIIIPVPMHLFRYLRRGFNQSKILSSIISDILNIPVKDTVVKRTRITRKMAFLSPEQRRKNVENAFNVYLNELYVYKKVLIIDDIITTGATFLEIKQALKKKGFERIDMAVFSSAFNTDRKSLA